VLKQRFTDNTVMRINKTASLCFIVARFLLFYAAKIRNNQPKLTGGEKFMTNQNTNTRFGQENPFPHKTDENLGKGVKAQRMAEKARAITAGVRFLYIDSLVPYSRHPFKLYEGKGLADMVESVKEFGIITPVIVRHIDEEKYEILSGHNRVNAARLVGLDVIPVLIKNNLSDEEAILIVTETNLQQRSFSELSHSERAICLAQHYAAMKCQGRRNDLINEIETLMDTSSQLGTKSRTDEKIASENGLSKNTVARYIRISALIPSLLLYLDVGKIAFLTAYQLSFIEDENSQNRIAEYVQSGYKVDMKKAEILREYYENGDLTDETISQVLSCKNPTERKSFKLSAEILDGFFNAEQGKNEIEQIIINALQFYYASFQNDNCENECN